MTITSKKLRHLAEMASLTSEGVSCLSDEQLTQIADHIDTQAARIAELEHERDSATLEYDYLNDQIQFHVAEHKKTFEKLLSANNYAKSLKKELAALREQKPICWLNDAYLARGVVDGEAGSDDAGPGYIPAYRQPVPAVPVAVPDDSINPIRGSKPFVVKLPNCVYDLHSVGPVMSAEDVIRAIKSAGGIVENE